MRFGDNVSLCGEIEDEWRDGVPGTSDTTMGSTSGAEEKGVLDNDAGESALEEGVDGVGVLESERVRCSTF